MRAKHKARASVGVFSGIIILALGLFIFFGMRSVHEGSAATMESDLLILELSFAGGSLLLLWGCMEQALAKGYSILVGLLGLLGVLGLAILAVMPEKPEDTPESKRTSNVR